MQHRSTANFAAPTFTPASNQPGVPPAPRPYRLTEDAAARRPPESTPAVSTPPGTTDYFSTAWQEAAELRPAMLVRRPRDSVRPIPLRLTQPRLGNLVPTEHWFARMVGWLLAGAITLGGAACILLFGLLNPQPNTIASPTLQRVFLHATQHSLRAAGRWNHPLIQGPLSFASIQFCILLIVSSFALFTIARRMAGVFGGLIALLLLTTSVAMQHQLDLAEPIALAGIALLLGGWRNDGIGRSLLGCVLLGIAASILHSQLLLLPLLLVAALDLPWRWSWLMPLAWLTPITLPGYFDARFFGVIPNLGGLKFAAVVSAHQRLPDVLMLMQNRNDPIWFLVPLAIAGIGLVARMEWRWAMLLTGMLLPAAGEYLMHGAADGELTMLLLPALLLASTWALVRSTWATGLITAVVSGLSLWIALAGFERFG